MSRSDGRILYQAEALASPGNDTNFAAFTLPTGWGLAKVRFGVELETASVLNWSMSSTLVSEVASGFKESATLNAGDSYSFDLTLARLDASDNEITYGLQLESTGIVRPA